MHVGEVSSPPPQVTKRLCLQFELVDLAAQSLNIRPEHKIGASLESQHSTIVIPSIIVNQVQIWTEVEMSCRICARRDIPRLYSQITFRDIRPCRCVDISLEELRNHDGFEVSSSMENLAKSASACRLCRLTSSRIQNAIKLSAGMRHLRSAIHLLAREDSGEVWIRALGLKLGYLHIYAHPGGS
jgi:hypothetical protein